MGAAPEKPSIKRSAMQRAQQKVLVVDSSKIGQLRTARFADAAEFDHIFTEAGPLEIHEAD